MLLCIISYKSKTCKLYLILHVVTFVAWKQSYSRFSEQLDFLYLGISMKFVLLKLYLLCFVSMAFSHLLYILALELFASGYLNVPAVQQPQKISEQEAAIRQEGIKIQKMMVMRAFVANQRSDTLQRFRR